MAPNPSENGVDGDDEREEEEEDEDEDEEEEEEAEEEEEDEPRLKYQRMGGSIPSLLSNDASSCIAVSERMIALGTHDGTVHILDFLGNQVKEFSAHTATVNDLSFDTEGEYVGSCSDDGYVVINSLFTDERMKFEYHRPMKAIALDPDYSRKSSRRFVAGGLAGHLYMNTKKWLGHRDQVLHSGEGPIHAVKWRTSLIAWANDTGVKVYDTSNDQRITFIERPRGSPRPELLLPHLVWQDDTLLVIGWGTSVKIAAIRTNQYSGANGTQRHISISSTKLVDIVASFQTSYFISGIAPYGDALVVLAYIPDEEDCKKEFNSTVQSRQGTAQRPEVRIVTWKNDELATDALPVNGFEHYKAKDYSLAHAPFSGSSYAGGQWAAGDEPLYYIVSPKDVVIAKPRDAEDHISWLLQHGWHEKALAAVEAGQGRSELLDEVGSRYLDHLIVERKYAEAASLCPKLLRGSASAWERWVFHFAHLRQLPVLVPYIPTQFPPTIFVVTTRNGVYGFTLDPLLGEFILSHDNVKVPDSGKIYAFNEGNYAGWEKGLQDYMMSLKDPEKHGGKPYSARYIGSLVGDFHRTLLYGGIYGYPADTKNKTGKLRLLYECAPMSLIMEQAGGLGSTGQERVLDVCPEKVHQRVPLFVGSPKEVEYLESFIKK